MDREEILKRSRAEKEDEGSTFLENRGRRAGVAGFCSMFTALLIFNFLTGQPSYSIHALFWCYISLAALPWGGPLWWLLRAAFNVIFNSF